MANTRPTRWTSILRDAGDGTGDGLIELPDEPLAALGWKEGDTLEIESLPDGKILVLRASAETGKDT